MITNHFFVWKSNEAYPIGAMPNCVFGSPKSNDFQKITTHKNLYLPHFISLSHPNETVIYGQNRNSYQRLIFETKYRHLRHLEVIGFNIKYSIILFFNQLTSTKFKSL